jgi:hypothetical protein
MRFGRPAAFSNTLVGASAPLVQLARAASLLSLPAPGLAENGMRIAASSSGPGVTMTC